MTRIRFGCTNETVMCADKLMTEPDSVTLVKAGIPDGAVITVTVSAPVVVKKAAPGQTCGCVVCA